MCQGPEASKISVHTGTEKRPVRDSRHSEKEEVRETWPKVQAGASQTMWCLQTTCRALNYILNAVERQFQHPSPLGCFFLYMCSASLKVGNLLKK